MSKDRTLHGVEIDSLLGSEREHWLRRYMELATDAAKRGDHTAEAMYQREVAKLLRARRYY